LGHIVGRDGLKVDPAKVKAVAVWPRPTRFVLSLVTNYFWKFIKGYAVIAAPLHALTNKGMDFIWGAPQEKAFTMLKQRLCSAPVLAIPDLNRPFTVISDASLHGTGAVLMQDDRPIAYTSRKFNPAERNYHTTDQELLGVVCALTEWRCYLEGSDCTLFTDHNALVHLQTQPCLNRRQVRWLEFLSRFEPGLKWQYKPGKAMMADPLSRNPVDACMCLHACALHAPIRLCPSLIIGISSKHDFLQRIKQAYQADPWIQANKATFRRHKDVYLMADKIVVPHCTQLKADIIHAHHAPKYSGHRGKRKTQAAVERTFWWPKMHLDVQTFVTTCDTCQRNKHSTQKPAGLF